MDDTKVCGWASKKQQQLILWKEKRKKKTVEKMGFYGLAYIIKVEQCEYIKNEKNPYKYRWSSFYSFAEKLRNVFVTHTMAIAINKNKLIEMRWKKKIYKPEQEKKKKHNNISLDL